MPLEGGGGGGGRAAPPGLLGQGPGVDGAALGGGEQGEQLRRAGTGEVHLVPVALGAGAAEHADAERHGRAA